MTIRLQKLTATGQGPALQMLTSQLAQGREGPRAHCTGDVQGQQLLSGKAGIKPRLSVSII